MFIYFLSILVLIQAAFAAGAQEVSVVYGHVAWSPNGKYICFTRSEVTNTSPRRMRSDLYISRPDGSEMRRLTGDNGNESFPSWSKDGKTIFFGSGAPGSSEQDIYSIGTDGKGLKLIERAPGRDGAPVVSPNGQKIIFNSTRDGGLPQIYVMNIDGSDPKRLTDDSKVAFYNPVWSPDGKRIVYYREIGDNKDQIWTMRDDGSDKKLLTNNIGHNFYPSWSHNGERVIFTRVVSEKQELYSMKADGSDLRPLGVDSFFGRVSPDGRRLAYIGGNFPKMSLWVANSDGTNPKNIVN